MVVRLLLLGCCAGEVAGLLGCWAPRSTSTLFIILILVVTLTLTLIMILTLP